MKCSFDEEFFHSKEGKEEDYQPKISAPADQMKSINIVVIET